MKYPSREFDEVVSRACDDAAGETELQALAELLARDPSARDAYVMATALHARLATDCPLAGQHGERTTAPGQRTPGQRPGLTTRRWAMVAAAATLLLAVSWLSRREPHVEKCATVAMSAGAEIAGEALVAGAPIGSETVTLSAGSVELLTPKGVRMVIEAPAEFRFESGERLHLVRGKAAADVPPEARGFTIVTPTGDAVDLGTRFGVDVPASGDAELHVYQGEVIARGNRRPGNRRSGEQSLKTGEAGAIGAQPKARELRSAAFIQADEMPALRNALEAGQRNRAREALDTLRRDPAFVAAADFEPQHDDISGGGEGAFRPVQGRFPGSHAAEFVDQGDHALLDATGKADDLTMIAWVRLDRIPQGYTSLYHGDAWGERGTVHWMVQAEQRMRFAVSGWKVQGNAWPESRSTVTIDTGRWTCLAVVYQSREQRVRFYIDGRLDNEAPAPTDVAGVFGPARLGNWTRQERLLSGRLDELVILRRALGDGEIEQFHAHTTPYR